MAKRLTALLMVLTLGLSVAGCSSSKTTTSSDTTTNTSTETAKESTSETTEEGKDVVTVISEKLIEPRYFLASENSYTYTGDEIGWKTIEHYTNIKFKPIHVPMANYNEKLSTTLASGDLPDMMGIRGAGTIDKYGPEGAFVELDPYMEKGMMNDYLALLDKYEDAKILSKSPNGKTYGVARVYDVDYLMDESWLARTDLLDKHGLTRTPETFDDLYDLMKALKEIYPDSTPYTSRWGLSHVISGQVDFRNTGTSYFLNKVTDQYEYGPASQGYKDSMIFLAQAYKDGILDPDCATISDEEFLEKFASNKAFFTYDYQIGDNLVQTAGSSLDEGFEVTSILQPSYNGTRQGAIILKGYYGFYKAIASTSKYTEELVKFLNWTCSEEGIRALEFGIEGETYEIDGEDKVKFLDDIKYAGNQNGTITNTALNDQNMFTVYPQLGKDTYDAAGEMAKKSAEFIESQDAFGDPYTFSKFYSEEDKKRYSDIMTPINTFVEEASMKVITGAMSIDEWDEKVIKVIEGMGLAEAGELINKAYKEVYGK